MWEKNGSIEKRVYAYMCGIANESTKMKFSAVRV